MGRFVVGLNGDADRGQSVGIVAEPSGAAGDISAPIRVTIGRILLL